MRFVDRWKGTVFESSTGKTKQFDDFCKSAKASLLRQAKQKGFTLYSFDPGHFYFSAVLKDIETEKYYYVSISDVRYWPQEWHTNILYRTMSHEKDWTGGNNHYCHNWYDLCADVRRLADEESGWRTWRVGRPAIWEGEDFDGKWHYEGIITEKYEDHLILEAAGMRIWIDDDFSDTVK